MNRKQFISSLIAMTVSPTIMAFSDTKCEPTNVIYDPVNKRWIKDPYKQIVFREKNQVIEFDGISARLINRPTYNEHNIVIGHSYVELKFGEDHKMYVPLVKRITDLATDKWSFWYNQKNMYKMTNFIEFIYNDESNLLGYN